MARRRRRTYEKKKPIAPAAIITAVIGLICFLTAVVLLLLAASKIDIGPLFGVVGVLTMLASMIAFATGVGTLRDSEREIVTRILGAMVPGAAMTVLLMIYFMGILFG